MKQNHIYQQIILEISDKESEKHLSECPQCRSISSKVNETMSLLETEIEVPESIASAVLLKNERMIEASRAGKLSLSGYLQISLVIVAGIFLGFILGKNADTSVFQSNKTRQHQALIEFREAYHLNVDESTFSFQ